MTLEQKVAYLKGVMDGKEINTETDEGKILHLISDILMDVVNELVETQDDLADANEYLEAIDEDLTDLEDELFGEDDGEYDCENCDAENCYEIVCPECGDSICVEEAPEGETVICPSCGKEIPLE